MRDVTKFQCPKCGNQTATSSGRTCEKCGYNGDWIQPMEILTYADNKKMLGTESLHEFLSDVPRKYRHWDSIIMDSDDANSRG